MHTDKDADRLGREGAGRKGKRQGVSQKAARNAGRECGR